MLDTDIGSDIDDAICLAYLLSQPKCELVGITTVSGESDKRAMLVSAICKAAGKAIPIYPGAENPLIIPQMQKTAEQARMLSNWEHDTVFPKSESIEFMRRTIRQNPGEITLLAIGPMTNIALLFAVDPEIPFLLKQLVLMCGIYVDRTAGDLSLEWNAQLDPHAAAMVFSAPVNCFRAVGLEVTQKIFIGGTEAKENFTSSIFQPVLDFAVGRFKKSDKIVLHDPLAGAAIFDDTFIGFKRGNVSIETVRRETLGMTNWIEDSENGKHQVALEVEPSEFKKHFFRVISES